MHKWKFTIFIFGYLVYLCFGAMVFSLMEAPVEDEIRTDLYNMRNKFKKDATCVTGIYKYNTFRFKFII